MPFLSLDDSFADHQKVWALSDRAFRLHASGLLFCSRLRTDGFVPADKVASLVPRYRRTALDELVAAERWLPVGVGAVVVSFEIRNYLEWNMAAAQIEARRKATAQRKSRWREGQLTGARTDG